MDNQMYHDLFMAVVGGYIVVSVLILAFAVLARAM